MTLTNFVVDIYSFLRHLYNCLSVLINILIQKVVKLCLVASNFDRQHQSMSINFSVMKMFKSTVLTPSFNLPKPKIA